MRCPHCATPNAHEPLCFNCGIAVSEPPAPDRPIDGLEATLREAREQGDAPAGTMPGLDAAPKKDEGPVTATSLAGLETTALEAAGEVNVAALAGLEATSLQDDAPVSVTPLPELETNEEVLGPGYRIVAKLPSKAPSVCPRCNAGTDGKASCPSCGARLASGAPEQEETLICLECSVPNPPDRQLCLACGIKLSA